MEKIFCNDRLDMLGKNDYDFFSEKEADYYRKTDQNVIDKNEIVNVEQELVTTNNGTIIAHTIKVPVILNDGRKLLLGILEDIT